MEASAQPGEERHAVEPRIVASGGEAMLFDAALAEPPTLAWFDRSWWQSRGGLRTSGGGRGGVAFLDTPVGSCVLRHYHRGGWMAPLLGDRYLWRGRA
ncbi:MAG: lipopolysaccharide kinase InaA family protein, partial [Rhodanobacteraceae bacterium]